MDSHRLTRRQRQVLDVIVASVCEHGYPPSYREIGEAIGVRSTNAVTDHVRALEAKGHIVRVDGRLRTLWPTQIPLPGKALERESRLVDALASEIGARSPLTEDRIRRSIAHWLRNGGSLQATLDLEAPR